MNTKKWISLAFAVLIFLTVTFPGATWAREEPVIEMEENPCPIDPTREEVMRLEQLSIAEDHGLVDESLLEAAGAPAVSVTRVQEPSLGNVGKWTISYNTEYGTPEICSIRISMKDWSDNYTTVYKKEWKEGAMPESYSSCTLESAGEYKLNIWVHFSELGEGLGWIASDYFDLEDDDTHVSLIEKVKSVVNECTADSKWQTALNLHDWIINHAYYDQALEFYGAEGVLLRGKGVCDSYSRAYIMLCREAGIPVSKVEGMVGPKKDGFHAWNAIELDEKWYYVDPTWDDSSTATAPFYTYFCLNEELMSIDHENDGNYFTGVCDSLDANYYIHTGKWAQWGDEYYWKDGICFARPFCEKLEKAIDGGDATCSITAEAIWKNKEDGSGVQGRWVNKLNMGIISWGLQNLKLELSGGGTVLIRSTYTDKGLKANLAGWAEPSTGVFTFPKDLQTISEAALTGTKADTLVLPSGCKRVGSQAFARSAVRTVYVPEGVEMEADAFKDCGRLIFVTSDENMIAYAKENHWLVANPSNQQN